jgi:hypothetical protein
MNGRRGQSEMVHDTGRQSDLWNWGQVNLSAFKCSIRLILEQREDFGV